MPIRCKHRRVTRVRATRSVVIRSTLAICMLALLTISRSARAQPVDAGIVDAAPPVAPITEEPPRILQQTPPIYPDVPRAKQKPVDVVVHVEVDGNGAATDARVVSVANAPFDDLAVAAVLGWTFEPAKQNGQPVASHLNVTVHFDPNLTVGGETITIKDKLTAIVRGHATAPNVGAQDIRVEAGKLAIEIPHKSSTELLGWAPGFLLTNEGGEGH